MELPCTDAIRLDVWYAYFLTVSQHCPYVTCYPASRRHGRRVSRLQWEGKRWEHGVGRRWGARWSRGVGRGYGEGVVGAVKEGCGQGGGASAATTRQM
jgi:hypothetical protein